MSKNTTYQRDFKINVALEAIKGELTINELATKHALQVKQIQEWKEALLSNASEALQPWNKR